MQQKDYTTNIDILFLTKSTIMCNIGILEKIDYLI